MVAGRQLDDIHQVFPKLDWFNEDTWLYHLQQQDYSRWFQKAIKDEVLAEEMTQIENSSNVSSSESGDRFRKLIEERYTLPA